MIALIPQTEAEWLGMAPAVAGGAVWVDRVGLEELREQGVTWTGSWLLASGDWLRDAKIKQLPLDPGLVVRALTLAYERLRSATVLALAQGCLLDAADAGHEASIAHTMLVSLGVDHEHHDPIVAFDEAQYAFWESHPYRYGVGSWLTPEGWIRRQRKQTPSGERFTGKWIAPDGEVYRTARKALLACGAPETGQYVTIKRAIEPDLTVFAEVATEPGKAATVA